MSLKIGDALLGLIVLVFLVSSFSFFISSAEVSTSLSAGVVSSGLTNLEDNLSGVSRAINDYTNKVDDSSVMSLSDNQLIEDRGADSGGVLNILSKNVLVRFFNALKVEIPSVTFVIKFALWFLGVLISILLIRFIWGDNKI